jgi:imidazolonepropionase-like amidohydrolase
MTTFISGGPIFDTSVGRFIDGHMVVVDGDRIQSLEPGLIDCHFHLISRSASIVTDQLITAGSIEGVIVGPRPYVTGPNPTGTGAPIGWRNGFVDGPLATSKMIREQWLAGTDETHSKGMRMSCHCEGLLAATRAVNAGIDGLDHGTVIDDGLASDIASRGVYYMPTLWAFSAHSALKWNYFGADQILLYEAREREHRLSFQRALAAGVLIGAGSDSPEYIPGTDVPVREIEALAAAGMSRADAIRAATINAARIIGQDHRLGSLEPGKLADLLVVEGNPLEDLRELASPRLVMQGGQVLVG